MCALSCLTLCNPTDCSQSGSSAHGISQARILGWVAIFFSKGSSWPRDRTPTSCIALAGQFFASEPQGMPSVIIWKPYFAQVQCPVVLVSLHIAGFLFFRIIILPHRPSVSCINEDIEWNNIWDSTILVLLSGLEICANSQAMLAYTSLHATVLGIHPGSIWKWTLCFWKSKQKDGQSKEEYSGL